jgi:hypothetical protein
MTTMPAVPWAGRLPSAEVKAEALTLENINLIAFAASEGTADAADVRQALDLFFRLVTANKAVPIRLTEYVAESFGRFLGKKYFHGPDERKAESLDSAFGLLRKQGRPQADEQRRIAMAASVLRLRLKKTSHQSALECAAQAHGSNTATVGEAWKVYLLSAIIVIRNERDPDVYPWTAHEKHILETIERDHVKRSEGGPKRSTQGKSLK